MAAVAGLGSALRELVELDDPIAFRRVCNPVSGVGGALAPPLEIRAEDGGVVARGVFVAPRPERIADYFGAVTDASGQHAPPGRPTDATAVGRVGGRDHCHRRPRS